MKRKKKGNQEWLSGKLGNVIGANWKGIDYLKTVPLANNSATAAQVSTRAKFALAFKLFQPIKELVAVSFHNPKLQMTGFNNAVSYTIKNALSGVYPDCYIDFSLLLLSRGDLPNIKNAAAVAQAGGNVGFTWTDNSGTGKAKPGDKVILAAYCEELFCCAYSSGSATRSAGSSTLKVPGLTGRKVHTYIGFLSTDGKDVASSVYTGEIQLV